MTGKTVLLSNVDLGLFQRKTICFRTRLRVTVLRFDWTHPVKIKDISLWPSPSLRKWNFYRRSSPKTWLLYKNEGVLFEGYCQKNFRLFPYLRIFKCGILPFIIVNNRKTDSGSHFAVHFLFLEDLGSGKSKNSNSPPRNTDWELIQYKKLLV